jgi:Swi5-dependent recombination DNA repair protein 1
MSTPAAKRRRIDAATSTLSKPFRSPFKSPLKVQPPASDNSQPSAPTSLETSSPLILSEKTPNLAVSPAVTPYRTLGKKKTVSPSISITAQLNADPEIAQLLRVQRDLEKQLREVKEQLETAEQAGKIERESRKTNGEGEIDGELVVLIGKWSGASRQAAEELFGKVRDRVNRQVSGILLALVRVLITL